MLRRMRSLSVFLMILALTLTAIPLTALASSCTVTTKAATSITANSARFNASVSWSGTMPKEVGVYYGMTPALSSMTLLGCDTYLYRINPLSFYYTTADSHVTLRPGTRYYYYAYAKIGSTIYWGARQTFVTQAAVPSSAKYTSLVVSDVTSSGAKVTGYYTWQGGVRPAQVGVQIGTTVYNLADYDADTSIPAAQSGYAYYTISGRKAGTTCMFRFYIKVNGVTYYSRVSSFKTAAAPAATDRKTVMQYASTAGVFQNCYYSCGCLIASMNNIIRTKLYLSGKSFAAATQERLNQALKDSGASVYSGSTHISSKADKLAVFKFTLNYQAYFSGGYPYCHVSLIGLSDTQKQEKLVRLVQAHPEGVLIYTGSHAVQVVDYVNGVFYCIEASMMRGGSVPPGHVFQKLDKTTLYKQSQADIIHQIWYVSYIQ